MSTSSMTLLEAESIELEYWLNRTANLAREDRLRGATSVKLSPTKKPKEAWPPRRSKSTASSMSATSTKAATRTRAASYHRKLTDQGFFIFLIVFYFPLLVVLVIPFVVLIFTIVGLPTAVWGLYVLVGVQHVEKHFQHDQWTTRVFSRPVQVLRNLSAILLFPLLLALFLVTVGATLPFFIVLWSPFLLLYAGLCLLCVRDRARFRQELGDAFRDAIDLSILMAVRALFPWLHSQALDEMEPTSLDVMQNQCAHSMRIALAATLVVVLQVALPIFDTVTDFLFLFEMIQRYFEGIPPAAADYYTSMVYLSGIATGVNVIIHILWLGILYRVFWSSYTFIEPLWKVSPQYLVPESYRQRVARAEEDDDDFRLPSWMPLTMVVKVLFGDVMHIVVLCMTFGFFGSTPSIPWLLNVVASVASVGILLGDAFSKLMFSRVIHSPVALAFLQAVPTIEFMAAAASPLVLLLLYPSFMLGGSVCTIPWEASDLTDDLLATVAATCTSVNFDLIVSNSSYSTWAFPLLAAAIYIEVSNNSYLTDIHFPALQTLSYPVDTGYTFSGADLADASLASFWCAQSVLGGACNGVCCSGSGLVVAHNPVLQTVDFPNALASALFNVGVVVEGDAAYAEINGYNELDSRSVSQLPTDWVRIVDNPNLRNLSLAINSEVFWVEVSGNNRLQNVTLAMNGLFVVVASNPALTKLTLLDAPSTPSITSDDILQSVAANAASLGTLRSLSSTATAPSFLGSVVTPDAYSYSLNGLWGYAGVVLYNNTALSYVNLSASTLPSPFGALPDTIRGIISMSFLIAVNNSAVTQVVLPQIALGGTGYATVAIVHNANLQSVVSSTYAPTPSGIGMCNCTITKCVAPGRVTAQLNFKDC